VTTAYDSAAGQSPDTTYAGADNQLGTKTLTAGVYRFTAASTANLVGNLTLSGSADDVWIFQATSTLVTAANSSVSFSGGAQACNVFWQVGSAATLGASSQFAGTILAHDDISLGNQVTVDGRLLAGGQANHAGAVSLIHDTITRSDCATVAATDSPTEAPVATATAGPIDTPTAAPAGATPTAAPAGATPTAASAGATLAAGASPIGTAGLNATAPSTDTLASQGPGPRPPIAGYLVLFLLAIGAIVIAMGVPGRARR
jgi:type VI secretion system secreted protein VgrG